MLVYIHYKYLEAIWTHLYYITQTKGWIQKPLAVKWMQTSDIASTHLYKDSSYPTLNS